jgi:hypothetical protein
MTAPLSFAQAQQIFHLLAKYAVNNYNRLKASFNRAFLQFCKYLFRQQLHRVFAEKGNIICVLELFQGFPKLIRVVFGKLSQ